MPTALFEFLPDLNNFLSTNRRNGIFHYSFMERQSIKHLIEAAGIPHTEVGQLIVNDKLVGMEYKVQEGDQVQVHPASAKDNPLPGEASFVLDNHLGRLATYLRMLGFDGIYRNDFDDDELARIAEEENRILLTRDRRLLMRRAIRWGYCPRSLDSRQQTQEVLRRFNLYEGIRPFQRCLRCNEPLQAISKTNVLDQLEPLTRKYYEEFHVCPNCGQIYWKGSHYEHMQELIQAIQKDDRL